MIYNQPKQIEKIQWTLNVVLIENTGDGATVTVYARNSLGGMDNLGTIKVSRGGVNKIFTVDNGQFISVSWSGGAIDPNDIEIEPYDNLTDKYIDNDTNRLTGYVQGDVQITILST